jgi:hypothetical protein
VSAGRGARESTAAEAPVVHARSEAWSAGQWRAVQPDPCIAEARLGVEVMGSGSSKSASSSSSTASAAGGGEEKKRNGSGKGWRSRSLLLSSSCFRGVAALCEGDAPAALPPAAAVEVKVLPRAVGEVGCCESPLVNAVNRARERVFPKIEC